MSTYGLWLSAAGMKLADHRQTLLANNMANAHTTGFKEDLAVVMRRPVESAVPGMGRQFSHPVLDGMTGGLNVRPSFHNFNQGSIEGTGGAFDVAIDGEGFLAVSDGENTRYTRDGKLALNQSNELIMAAGDGLWRVVDEAGTPIAIDPELGDIRIGRDGTIRQGVEEVAKLQLVAPDDMQAMNKVGQNLFDAGDAEMTPAEATLIANSLERSNFDALSGLAQMIETSRAFQLNATMIQMQDQATGQAISRVGRAS